MIDLPLLAVLTFVVAVLYSSVGHGGASGYLAAMALVGMAPESMRPTALVLNLLVAGTGALRAIRSGCFRWRSFWPFAVGSIPFAFLGGASVAPGAIYRGSLGISLVVAALGLLWQKKDASRVKDVPVVPGILAGAAIGFTSGLIGVGGGIFLSPFLILGGWATTRQTLGVASLFIFVNSAAGLAGHAGSGAGMPTHLYSLAAVAFVGGLIGSELGTRRLSPPWLRRMLAVVLLIAAVKLLAG